MDIEKKLQELKAARVSAEYYHAATKKILDEVKASEDYVTNAESAKFYDAIATSLENEIKLKALEEYEGTKNKSPFAKVSIKIFKTFKILDPERVRVWAWNNLPVAFKLDEGKIKDYAQKFGDVPGTEKGEEPRALIATDL